MRLVCLFHIILDLFTLHILFSAPSAAPEEIKLKEVTSTSITLMWGPVPCDHRNGNITGYVVRYRKYGSGVFRNETTG